MMALLPGIKANPARRTSSRAGGLVAISFMAREDGPIKPIRQLSQTSANAVCGEKTVPRMNGLCPSDFGALMIAGIDR